MAQNGDLVKQVLSEHDPNLDLSGGTAAQDILVNAPDYILSYVLDSMQVLQDERNLSDVSLLPDVKLDRVGNQIFVPRSTGIKATGVVRVYFTKPVTKTLSAGTAFQTTSGLRFIAKRSVSITLSEMMLNIEGNYYFMDIPSVEAEQAGASYSIGPYEIVMMVGSAQDVVKVTNPQPFTVGSDAMDNSRYIEAIKRGISIRDLVVENSIYTVLSQQYPQYTDYVISGYRDDEMERDTLYDLAIGGCVDIYPMVNNALSYEADLSPASGISYGANPVIFVRRDSINTVTGEDYTGNTITGLPVSEIISVEQRGVNGVYTPLTQADLRSPAPTGAYFIRIPLGYQNVGLLGLPPGAVEFWNPRGYFQYDGISTIPGLNPHPDPRCLTHSMAEESILVMVKNDGGFYGAGDTFRIRYTGADTAVCLSMQQYVDDRSRKTINADHLIRAMIPVTVDIDVRVVGLDTVTMSGALSDMVTNATVKEDITTANIINTLINNGAATVDLPITITYRAHLPGGMYYSSLSATTGMINIADIQENYYKYINRNIRFSPGNITITSITI